MSFTPNIPTSGQTLGGTRDAIRNNFSSLRSTLSNETKPNHIDVNDLGAGKHAFVQMPVQTEGAGNLPEVNEGGLITQTVGSKTELFYVRDAVAEYIRMTGQSGTKAAPNDRDGYATLFGGFLLQWLYRSYTSNGTKTEPFPIEFASKPFVVTGYINRGSVEINSIDLKFNEFTFGVAGPIGVKEVSFFAIGPQ